MAEPLFVSVTDEVISEKIRAAKNRVLLAAPSIGKGTATALGNAMKRIDPESFVVVTDCDEKIFRLGYGDFAAVKELETRGLKICQQSGLRAGILVCDSTAWSFSPTALYVEEETRSNDTPNGIVLRGIDVERIVSRLLPSAVHKPTKAKEVTKEISPELTEALKYLPPASQKEIVESMNTPQVDPEIERELSECKQEVGLEAVDPKVLENVGESLEEAPPIPFDVARQVRVFEPYIQYVEIKLNGCSIARHRIKIPKSVLSYSENQDLDNRLRTTFDLLQANSEYSAKSIEQLVWKVRDNFTRSLGQPYGRVLLRNKRGVFDEKIKELQEKLKEHQDEIEESLKASITESERYLIEYYLPFVKKNPPDELVGQLNTTEVTEAQVRGWLAETFQSVFPSPDELVKKMELCVHFRDVTFENISEQDFSEKLKKAFKHVKWDKPFDEFNTAKEKACE